MKITTCCGWGVRELREIHEDSNGRQINIPIHICKKCRFPVHDGMVVDKK